MKIDQIEEAQKKKAKALLTLGSVNAIGQFALIFYGTFHYLSWDIMEPVCYLMTFGNFTAGYFFYVYMKKDLDLDNFHEILTYRFTRTACQREGIDLNQFEKMKEELQEMRK